MQTDHIDVYNESPAWDSVDRWWKLPAHVLEELFVARYVITGESVDIEDVRRHAREVAKLHPGCVLVHI